MFFQLSCGCATRVLQDQSKFRPSDVRKYVISVIQSPIRLSGSHNKLPTDNSFMVIGKITFKLLIASKLVQSVCLDCCATFANTSSVPRSNTNTRWVNVSAATTTEIVLPAFTFNSDNESWWPEQNNLFGSWAKPFRMLYEADLKYFGTFRSNATHPE